MAVNEQVDLFSPAFKANPYPTYAHLRKNAPVYRAIHDPKQFDDPQVLKITREVNQHIAFGHGIHYCLGAPLARLEGEIAINTLLRRRLPNLQLAVAPEELYWRPGMHIRGLQTLPVKF